MNVTADAQEAHGVFLEWRGGGAAFVQKVLHRRHHVYGKGALVARVLHGSAGNLAKGTLGNIPAVAEHPVVVRAQGYRHSLTPCLGLRVCKNAGPDWRKGLHVEVGADARKPRQPRRRFGDADKVVQAAPHTGGEIFVVADKGRAFAAGGGGQHIVDGDESGYLANRETVGAAPWVHVGDKVECVEDKQVEGHEPVRERRRRDGGRHCREEG